MVSQGFFSGSASAEKRTTRFAGDKENTDTSNLKVESPSVQVANVKSYTDSTFTPSYPGDPYRDALRETDKPKKVDKKTYIQSRMAEKMYDGDIDKFKRKTLDYKTGTDFFGDKVDYSPETIKRYISTDAKENYEKDQAFEREKQLNEARRIAKQERKNIDDKAYVRAMQKFDKPSITQRVSNFVFGTDLKGKPDPRNPNILSKDERISTLRGVQRVYNEPGISVDPYGVLTRRNLGEQKPTSELSVKDFKAKENIERRKIFREQAGMSPNPNLMERTQNFLSGVADNVGNVVDNVSKIFTPKVEAGTLEGKPTRFTMGESNVPSMSTPSVGDMVSNIGAAVEAGGMGGLGSSAQSSRVRTLGRPQPRVQSPMEAGMGPGAAKARAMAKARNAAKESGTASPSMSGADRAKALARARIARKKKSTSSGTGFGRSTSSSRSSTGRAGRRGGSAGSAGSRSRGGTSRGSSRSGTRSSSSRGQGSRSRSTSRSRGGVSRGSRRRGGRRGRRGGRRCDIRCKINISPLINTNLVRDDLAELAYFVKEIK
tara:strand:- start:1100 stop:2734 length:1635 start_codon:yes stop_codon:yes gene_type:complete